MSDITNVNDMVGTVTSSESAYTRPESSSDVSKEISEFGAKRRKYLTIALIMMIPVGVLYYKAFCHFFDRMNAAILYGIFTISFVVMIELLLRAYGKKITKEAIFWDACLVILGIISPICEEPLLTVFITHGIAVFSVLVRGGVLRQGHTGGQFLADIFSGIFSKGFGGMGEAFKDADYLGKHKEKEKKEKKGDSVLQGILCIVVSVPILLIVANILSNYNDVIKNVMKALYSGFLFTLRLFSFQSSGFIINTADFFWSCLLGFVVGLFLYCLASKAAKSDGQAELAKGKKFTSTIDNSRKASRIIPSIVVSAFSLLYISFFCSSGGYFFSAFFGNLPKEFTAAEYTRQGFGDMLIIVFLNLLIFFLVRLFSSKVYSLKNYLNIALALLMTESIVFVVISFSKICLYISRFGYTENRAFSLLCCTSLGLASILAGISIISKKNVARIWIVASTIFFIAYCVVSVVMNISINNVLISDLVNGL